MNKINVLIIPADWDKPVKLSKIEPNLETFQRLVGGYIEEVSGQGAHGYVHEEGKYYAALQKNLRATSFGDKMRMFDPDDYLVGDLVLFGDDGNGNETDVPPAIVAIVEKITGRPVS